MLFGKEKRKRRNERTRTNSAAGKGVGWVELGRVGLVGSRAYGWTAGEGLDRVG